MIIPPELLKSLPRTVRDELPTLPKDGQQKFMDLYNARKKNLLFAYILCLLYGLHYMYLEETGTGIWFWFTIGGVCFWWIVDFFRVPGMVRSRNSFIALKTLGEVKPMVVSGATKF
jgi:hypothetical protein